LIALPAIGRGSAAAIADVIEFGHWRWPHRLQGDANPARVLSSIPTVGPGLALRFHTELHIEKLDDLKRAVHDGRLGRMRGIGDKHWHAIRDALVVRRRLSSQAAQVVPEDLHAEQLSLRSSDMLLSIDAEYRTKADLNYLPTIAPIRFNPTRAHRLPILHAERNGRDFTALFSNTARAHELWHTDDWVVISADEGR
jgi:hypothetical protein